MGRLSKWAHKAFRPWSIFQWLAVLLWLAVTWISVVGIWSDWSAFRCGRDDRLRLRFEDLLFYHPTNPIGMVGPDGNVVPNYSGPVPIAGEIAACFPSQIVDGNLRLPPGEVPGVFKSAVLASFELSLGERDESYEWVVANSYPMTSTAAPCVKAATRRIYDITAATVPPPDPRCRPLAIAYVTKWLVVGWGPALLVLLAIWAVRARTAAAKQTGMSGWRCIRAIGLAVVSACALGYCCAVLLLLGWRQSHHLLNAAAAILAYWLVAYVVIPFVARFIRRLPP